MPINSEYHGSSWFVDPTNLQLYEIMGDTITGNMLTMYELTGGVFNASGGAIRDAATGRIVQPLQPEYPAQLSVMPGGQLIFSRETAAGVANDPTASYSRRGATGNAEILLPNGETRSVEVAPWLTGQDTQTLVRDLSLPGDEYRFRPMSIYTEAGQAVEPDIPVGWRYATPEENIDRGLIGEMARTRTDELREMVALGMVDQNGEPITDVYEAAEYAAYLMTVTPSLSSVLM